MDVLCIFKTNNIFLVGEDGEKLAVVTNTKEKGSIIDCKEFLKTKVSATMSTNLYSPHMKEFNNLIWMTFDALSCQKMRDATNSQRCRYYLEQLEKRRLCFFDYELAATILGGDSLQVLRTGQFQELGRMIDL